MIDPGAVEGSSLVQAAYRAVRDAIVTRRLQPGSRVTVRPFAEQLGTSPTPVKAALAILEREGFLVSRQHAGFFVAELGVNDMRDIYELRSAVDALAAREAARNRPPALLASLEQLLDEQRAAVAAGDIARYAEVDRRFHAALWAASSNRRLFAVADLLGAQLQLGQAVTIAVPGRPEASLVEHAEILDAVREGDTAAAENAVRRHVAQVLRALETGLPVGLSTR